MAFQTIPLFYYQLFPVVFSILALSVTRKSKCESHLAEPIMGHPDERNSALFHKFHAALGAVSRLVLNHLWMHRAGVLHGLPVLLGRLIG